MNRTAIAAIATTLLLTTVGCAPEEEEFQFGATEMEAAIAGQWEGTLEIGGQSAFLEVSLQRLPPQASASCDSRELSHPQCMTTSSMRFEGVVTTDDGRFDGALAQGELMIDGYELTFGYLSLAVGDGSSFSAAFEYPQLQEGDFSGADGTLGSFQLVRPLD